MSDLVRKPRFWFHHAQAHLQFFHSIEPHQIHFCLITTMAEPVLPTNVRKMVCKKFMSSPCGRVVNPFLTNGFSQYYHLGESAFIFRGIRSEFQSSYNFLMKILLANRIATDGTPRSATSHMWLYCLPMSHKKDDRLK